MKKPNIHLHTLKKENVFQVPFHYFEQLPTEIQQQIAALNGYQVAQLPKERIFKVPVAYFKTLPKEIQEKLSSQQVLSNAPQQVPFEVPAQFFEGLTNRISQKVAQTSLEGIEKTPVFQTPARYFEWLPAKIHARIRANTQPKPALNWSKTYVPVSYLALGALSVWLLLAIFNQKTLEPTPQPQQQTAQNDTEIPLIQNDKIDTLQNGEATSEDEPIIIQKQVKILAKTQSKPSTQQENKSENTKDSRIIDFEIEQLESQDILNYLSYTALSENLLLEIMLENEEETQVEEIVMALNQVLEEDIYEEIHHEELKELNLLLKETKL